MVISTSQGNERNEMALVAAGVQRQPAPHATSVMKAPWRAHTNLARLRPRLRAHSRVWRLLNERAGCTASVAVCELDGRNPGGAAFVGLRCEGAASVPLSLFCMEYAFLIWAFISKNSGSSSKSCLACRAVEQSRWRAGSAQASQSGRVPSSHQVVTNRAGIALVRPMQSSDGS